MKPSPTMLAASSLLAILGTSPARADDIALNFNLPARERSEAPAAVEPVAESASVGDESSQPLPVPAQAANPPMRYHSPQQLPAGVYRRAVAVALSDTTPAAALLPPSPPLVSPAPVVVAVSPKADKPVEKPTPERLSSFALNFGLAPSPREQLAQASPPPVAQTQNPLQPLFDGDTDSLVARAVGSAEGTRTPSGAITRAYYGHTDPGNQVWNMGTFSYQHGATSPQEADQKQLKRLQSQTQVLKQRAKNQGLNLTLEETLNGIDLANQSPLAAIGRVGYIERLAEAKANGYVGTEAIVVARTRSYINPNTQRWNAPGLGNTQESITRDQQRRANAVASTIAAYQQQQPQIDPKTWALEPVDAPPQGQTLASALPKAEDPAIQFWRSDRDAKAPAPPAEENQPSSDPTEPLLVQTETDGAAETPLWRAWGEFQPSTESMRQGLKQVLTDSLSLTPFGASDSPTAPESQSLLPVQPEPAQAENASPAIEPAPSELITETRLEQPLEQALAEVTPAPAKPVPELAATKPPLSESPAPPDNSDLPSWEQVREGNQGGGTPMAATEEVTREPLVSQTTDQGGEPPLAAAPLIFLAAPMEVTSSEGLPAPTAPPEPEAETESSTEAVAAPLAESVPGARPETTLYFPPSQPQPQSLAIQGVEPVPTPEPPVAQIPGLSDQEPLAPNTLDPETPAPDNPTPDTLVPNTPTPETLASKTTPPQTVEKIEKSSKQAEAGFPWAPPQTEAITDAWLRLDFSLDSATP